MDLGVKKMGHITEIEVRPDKLIEVLSMAVLHCRQEIHKLDYDAASVLDDKAFRELLAAPDDARRTLQLLLKDPEGQTLYQRVISQIGATHNWRNGDESGN